MAASQDAGSAENVTLGMCMLAYRRGAKLVRVSWRRYESAGGACDAAVLLPAPGYVVVDALMALDAWCLMGA